MARRNPRSTPVTNTLRVQALKNTRLLGVSIVL
jgi:hypothetical protein